MRIRDWSSDVCSSDLQYAKALRPGCLPVARGIALTAEDRLRRDIIQALMCRFAVDLRAEALAHGQPGFHFSDGLSRLRPLAAEISHQRRLWQPCVNSFLFLCSFYLLTYFLYFFFFF